MLFRSGKRQRLCFFNFEYGFLPNLRIDNSDARCLFLRGIKAFVDREIGSIFLLRFLEIIRHNLPEISPLTPFLQYEKPGLVKLLFYK